MLAAIAAHAEALSACRVAADDIAEAASLATQLAGADAAQKGAMQTRAGSTEDRVDTQLRLEQAVDDIHVAGTFAFRKDPAIRGRFERLISSAGPAAGDDTDVEDGGPPPAPPPGPTS